MTGEMLLVLGAGIRLHGGRWRGGSRLIKRIVKGKVKSDRTNDSHFYSRGL